MAATDESGCYILDGSILEGGGQVLRQSLALAAILRKRVKVVKVRGGRAKPGLQKQHLTGIELVARMSEAKLEGAQLDSASVEFIPKNGLQAFSAPLEADTRSAGAVALLLQISLPCLLMVPAAIPQGLLLKGGTNATAAPQLDYVELVFLPTLRRLFGFDVDVKTLRRGFYPKGRGEVRVTATPVREIRAISLLERGEVERVHIRAFSAGREGSSAQQMANAANRRLRLFYPELPGGAVTVEAVQETQEQAFGAGGGVILVATTSTGCLIAGAEVIERGKGEAEVGTEAAAALVANLEKRGAVDEYLQDQLIIFMALAKGNSCIRTGEITLHTETALHFANVVAGVETRVDKQEDGTFLIHVNGLGFSNDISSGAAPRPPPCSSLRNAPGPKSQPPKAHATKFASKQQARRGRK